MKIHYQIGVVPHFQPLAALFIFSLFLGACRPSIRSMPKSFHSETQWVVQASLPLDALAFLNSLSEDPLVGGHYALDAANFKGRFTPVEEQAAARLADFRENTLGGHLSGFLCTWFLAGKPETLDDLIRLAENPSQLRQNLIDYDHRLVEMNVYYNEAAWKNFQKILPDVKILIDFLKTQGFEKYWQDTIRPRIEPDLARVQVEVQAYNIVPQIEAVTGFSLPSSQVTVSLLYYVWPYGHHLIGTHFVTIPDDRGVIRSTVHELLHNPFNNTDPAFWKAANSFKDNPDLAGAFERRNAKYGYNNWPDYVAEDSVRALEQLLEVKLGLGERWTWAEDGGMHQLAARIYERMQQVAFPQNGESYQAFVIRIVDQGGIR